MSKQLVSVFSVAWLALVACATSEPIDRQASDAMTTSTIKTKLAANPQTNPFEIDVDTQDGEVRLTGLVETEAERSEAERLAKNTDGVRSVDNQIELGDQTTGEVVNDAWILTKVKSKLAADPEVNPFNIDVDVTNGQVTLSGVVRSDRARTEAERLAEATQGVTSVQNRIEVR
jgi:osmotically-inducible protein OsmY